MTYWGDKMLKIKFWFVKAPSADVSWWSNICTFFLWLLLTSGNVIYSTKQTPQRKVKVSTQKGNNQKGRVKEGHAASESFWLSYTYRLPLLNMQCIGKKRNTESDIERRTHIDLVERQCDICMYRKTRHIHFHDQKVQSPLALGLLHTCYRLLKACDISCIALYWLC